MIRRGYVDLADGQVHYRRIGSEAGDAVPVLFLHQTASSGRMWEKVMVRLAGPRPLIAIDTPGFGGSFDPPDPPTMAQYAGWAAGSLDALGYRRAHVVGHHTGAAIALELASHASDRVASLALIGPNASTGDQRAALAGLGAAFRPTRSGAYLLKNWEYLRVGGANADVALLHAEMVDMLRAWASRPHAYAAVSGQDALALLAQVTCPTLLMAAVDDMLFPQLERAGATCLAATTLTLSGGANFEPDLAADEVVAALAAHLDVIA